MQFEWDLAKGASNRTKHDISFEDATLVWADARGVVVPTTFAAETRWMLIGAVDGVVLAVVYTMRGDVTRLISARYASRNERRTYDQVG